MKAERGHRNRKQKYRNLLAEHIDVNKGTYNQVLFDAVTLNNVDNIRYAVSLGARIEDRNYNGETALDLAVSLDRRPLIDELLRLGADINQKNSRENTCIYEQMKLGHYDMVEYLLSQEGVKVNERNNGGKTYLHLAASLGHVEFVKCLLVLGATVNARSNDGRTPLHCAAQHGEIECAKLLIALGADMDEKDNHHNTPLLHAARHHLYDMCRFLVQREAKIAGQNLDGETVVKLISSYGHIELLEMMLNSLIEQCKPHLLHVVVGELVRVKENIDKVDELAFFRFIFEKLNADSSFDELVGFELIVILHSPIKFLNWMLKEDTTSTSHDCLLTRLLTTRFFSVHSERTLLRFLLRLNYFTLKCATKHEIERKSLIEFANRVEAAIGEVFRADRLEHHSQVLQLLLPDDPLQNRLQKRHKLLEYARCFQDESSLLTYCLSNRLKILFDKPQVAGIVEKLFRTPLRETLFADYSNNSGKSNNDDGRDSPDYGYSGGSHTSSMGRDRSRPASDRRPGGLTSKAFDLRSLRVRRSLCLRSCPAAMYFLDFTSKLITLALTGWISIQIYGHNYGLDYEIGSDQVKQVEQTEIWMIVLILTSILHELGELVDNDWSLETYLQDEWNVYDVIEYGLCLGWLCLRFTPGYFSNARICLALAAIPQSQGLMRYLSVYRPIGELVIIVKAMTIDLLVFLIIYLTSIFGFGIAFGGLFYSPQNKVFGTNIQTLLSLFSFTLGNFEFDVFNATSKVVNTMGTILTILFILMTAIVLINLLIARMTSSHERVHDQALREWSFAQAQTVSSLLLWREKNPLSMLPPPFNAISMTVGAFEYYVLPILRRVWSSDPSSASELAQYNSDRETELSYAGSVSNLLLIALIGTILRLLHAMYRLVHKVFGSAVHPVVRLLSFLSLLTAPIWYPFYDWLSLLQERDVFLVERVDGERNVVYSPLMLTRQPAVAANTRHSFSFQAKDDDDDDQGDGETDDDDEDGSSSSGGGSSGSGDNRGDSDDHSGHDDDDDDYGEGDCVDQEESMVIPSTPGSSARDQRSGTSSLVGGGTGGAHAGTAPALHARQQSAPPHLTRLPVHQSDHYHSSSHAQTPSTVTDTQAQTHTNLTPRFWGISQLTQTFQSPSSAAPETPPARPLSLQTPVAELTPQAPVHPTIIPPASLRRREHGGVEGEGGSEDGRRGRDGGGDRESVSTVTQTLTLQLPDTTHSSVDHDRNTRQARQTVQARQTRADRDVDRVDNDDDLGLRREKKRNRRHKKKKNNSHHNNTTHRKKRRSLTKRDLGTRKPSYHSNHNSGRTESPTARSTNRPLSFLHSFLSSSNGARLSPGGHDEHERQSLSASLLGFTQRQQSQSQAAQSFYYPHQKANSSFWIQRQTEKVPSPRNRREGLTTAADPEGQNQRQERELRLRSATTSMAQLVTEQKQRRGRRRRGEKNKERTVGEEDEEEGEEGEGEEQEQGEQRVQRREGGDRDDSDFDDDDDDIHSWAGSVLSFRPHDREGRYRETHVREEESPFLFSAKDLLNILRVFSPHWTPPHELSLSDLDAQREKQWRSIDSVLFRICQSPSAVPFHVVSETEGDDAAGVAPTAVPANNGAAQDRERGEEEGEGEEKKENNGEEQYGERRDGGGDSSERQGRGDLLTENEEGQTVAVPVTLLQRLLSMEERLLQTLTQRDTEEDHSSPQRREEVRGRGDREKRRDRGGTPINTTDGVTLRTTIDKTFAVVYPEANEDHEGDEVVDEERQQQIEREEEKDTVLRQQDETFSSNSSFDERDRDHFAGDRELQLLRKEIASLVSVFQSQQQSEPSLSVSLSALTQDIALSTTRTEDVVREVSDVRKDVSVLKSGLKRDVTLLKSDVTGVKSGLQSVQQDVQLIKRDLSNLLRLLREI